MEHFCNTGAKSVSPNGRAFVDRLGRQLVLHGVNMVCKDKKAGYTGAWGEADFKRLMEWGFNVVRLGIIWDGVEPEPGRYDEEYLGRIEEQVKCASKYGMYVFLDMHQDLYSCIYGDGAPGWATLTDGNPHIDLGGVWSDAYLTSPAIQTAFDNFWENRPTADGTGLQDHYAAAWRHVAERFGADPCVIGYDIMNEPFTGSKANEIQLAIYEQFAKEAAAMEGKEARPTEEVINQWLDPEGRREVLKVLGDVDLYKRVIDSTEKGFKKFEETRLTPMFDRVAAAIREVDDSTMLFLETSYFSNMGVYSGIKPVTLKNGGRDPYQVYAPHGYDIVTDTENGSLGSEGRTKLIFSRHDETGERLGMPMLIGEWGAFYNSMDKAPAAKYISELFEVLLCSDTYWSYEGAGLEKYPHFRALKRGYPMSAAGKLESYHFDIDTKSFTCEWNENSRCTGSTVVYLPDCGSLNTEDVKLSPQGGSYRIEAVEGCSAGYVVIPPLGRECRRSIDIRPRK